MHRQHIIARCLGLVFPAIVTASVAAQSEVQFTRLLDTTAVAPGSGGSAFSGFRRALIDGEDIAFRGFSNAGANFGHYILHKGEVILAADYNTPIPNGAGNFDDFQFGDAVLRNGSLAFVGEGPPSQSGVYRFDDGSLSMIYDESINIPGAAVPFTIISQLGWDGGTLVIGGASTSTNTALSGLYRSVDGDAFEKVANGNDLYPGAESNFNWMLFQNPIVENGITSFGAAASNSPIRGFVAADARNNLSVIFNTTPDPWPLPGVHLIGGQSPVAVDGGRLLCAVEENDVSAHTEGSALILRIGQAMHSVVDFTMPYPGVPGNFFWNVYDVQHGGAPSEAQASLAGDLLAFRVAWGNGDNGNNNPPALFVRRLSSGQFIRLVGVGDQFDGGVVSSVELSHQAIKGNRVVFITGFEDGTDAIYLAEIPQPVCAGDATGDCIVDVDDLVAIILVWGACGVPCPGDVNGSGTVDIDDLIAVILNWA